MPAEVLQGYEQEYRQELYRLIRRTEDPALREKLEDMLECPVRDSRGHCRGFAEYILSSLLKQGVHNRYDIEAALSYVVEKMLMATTGTGSKRATLFSGFQERPHGPGFNPLQARFMQFLQFAVNNIRRGRIPRLAHVGHRPSGTVTIGQGRSTKGEAGAVVSPESIPARRTGDADLAEMIEDIALLLRRKESAYGLPLVDLFRAILGGMNAHEQRQRFGDRRTRIARQVIALTIEEYGEVTGNYGLLNQLRRLREPRQPVSPRPSSGTANAPKISDKERDYASILSVINRFDRPVGSADLGKYRRRWLDYPPRNPLAGHRNRLEEVLSNMVSDGVLRVVKTKTGAVQYEPRPKPAIDSPTLR